MNEEVEDTKKQSVGSNLLFTAIKILSNSREFLLINEISEKLESDVKIYVNHMRIIP